MSKTIRVTNEVYDRIQALQAPRETIGQVIDRCLSTVEAIRALPIREWPRASTTFIPEEELKHEVSR